MKTEKVTVTVPSIFGYEEVVVEAVGTIARVRKFPFEKVSKLKVAVAEACINAIEHGNQKGPDKDVKVTIVYSDDAIDVSVKDSGTGEVDPSFEMIDLREQIKQKKIGQWGLHLMRSLVDDIKIDAEIGEGTTTTVTIFQN